MKPILYRTFTLIKYQLPIALWLSTLISAALWLYTPSTGILGPIDRSEYVTFLAAVASIIALFCSLSIAWILFISQQNKNERITTYDLFKERLSRAQQWLLEHEQTKDRELCLSLIWELDKHSLSDLPNPDLTKEFQEFSEVFKSALDGNDDDRRQFYLISACHFGYIEQLVSRIGIISIKQVIGRIFLDTFAKGIFLIALTVLTLVLSIVLYSDLTVPYFLVLSSFIAIGSILLLIEIAVEMRRYYNEELDFIDGKPTNDDESNKTISAR